MWEGVELVVVSGHQLAVHIEEPQLQLGARALRQRGDVEHDRANAG